VVRAGETVEQTPTWAETEQGNLRRLRDGDRGGVEELMDHYGEDLMRYLAAILGSRGAAEDAFQDTWPRVMERIDRYCTHCGAEVTPTRRD